MNEDLGYNHLIEVELAEDNPTNSVIAKIFQWGMFDESHHKQWTLDQVLRDLSGDKYDYYVHLFNNDEEYENWDVGIAP